MLGTRRHAWMLAGAWLVTSTAWVGFHSARGSAAAVSTAADVCNIHTSERVIVVGDIHGAFEKFVVILKEAGIIDGRRRWIAGRAILVQTGDILDRGPDSREAIDLLRKLEGEADRAGGQVHVVLGNHEVMRMFNVRQYISDGEYAEFKTTDSETLRDNAYEFVVKENADRARKAGIDFKESDFRRKFYAETPLGSIEMQIAFSPTGDYGKWLRQLPAMVKINDIAFLHGGVSSQTSGLGCKGINEKVTAELKAGAPADQQAALITGPRGPLWYRGLVDGEVADREVDAILKDIGAKSIVVGHTPHDSFKIRSLFDGRVIQIDTGMVGGKFFPGGVPSALEIMNGTYTAIYEGKREVIVRPNDPNGGAGL